MAADKARETALKILHDISRKGAYSNIALGKHLDDANLNELDRSFITELVYGTVKWKLTIDWIIGNYSKIKTDRISPWIMDILRLGIFQIFFLDKIPVSAACNESVELAKKYGHKASGGFVNGIMRTVARENEKRMIAFPRKENDLLQYLSIKHSFPKWLASEWNELFGSDFTEELMMASNNRPEFCVRANLTKTTRDELIKTLKDEGISAEKGIYAEEAVILKNPSSITRLDAFKKGFFQVQDESSMLVGRVLDPQPGELVVDVCSAPGGKSTHLAEMMKNKGTVIARDIHAHKIRLIEDASARLGLDIIKTELFDALEFDDRIKEKADRVLADVPCSGLGIIRRKPDIKWSREAEERKEIIELQKRILRCAAGYVKPGGTLVYSTCTIGPWENEDIVDEFLGENKDFEYDDLGRLLPERLKEDRTEKGYIHLYPNLHGVDGFFISRLVRKV